MAAIDAGAHGIEFDVRLTEDGVPVVLHDDGLKRTHDRDELVARLLASDLPDDVPHLGDVLQRVGSRSWDGILDVELKVPVAPEVLAGLVPDTIAPERILVTSFDARVVRAYTDHGRFRAGILIRRHPFSRNIIVRSRPTHLEAVVTYIQHRRDLDLRRHVRTEMGRLLRETNAHVALVQDPGFVALDECRRVCYDAKVELWIWTLNQRRQWARARRYGADAVITDLPAEALSMLA